MRRRSAGVGDNGLAEAVGVPGFHRRSLVGRREGGENCVAGLDLGEITFDDLRLVTVRPAAEVPPHRVNRLPSDLVDEGYRPPTVLIGVRRAGKVYASHAPYSTGMESSRSREFVALGHAGSDHYAGLETFANPGVSQVEMTSDELTAVCPVTGQPDLYVATIEYWPQALCIESKSLKLYLSGYRNDGHFCEALAVKIRDDVAEALELPTDKVRVTLKQKARGGISITATT